MYYTVTNMLTDIILPDSVCVCLCVRTSVRSSVQADADGFVQRQPQRKWTDVHQRESCTPASYMHPAWRCVHVCVFASVTVSVTWVSAAEKALLRLQDFIWSQLWRHAKWKVVGRIKIGFHTFCLTPSLPFSLSFSLSLYKVTHHL